VWASYSICINVYMFICSQPFKWKIQSLFLPILESLFYVATVYTYITVHGQNSKKYLMHVCSLTCSLACNECTRARLQHTYYILQQLCLLYFVENCSLYYLSVEICVVTIRNLQPLDAEKLLVNVGVGPRKWRDYMWLNIVIVSFTSCSCSLFRKKNEWL